MSRSGLTTRDRIRGRGGVRGQGGHQGAGRGRPTGDQPVRAGLAGVTALRTRRRGRVRARTPRRRLVQVLVAVLLVAGVTTWLVLASPLLSVRGVAVDGARTLTAEEVRTAAGVTTGQALLRVDTDAVAARVAALPPVASVEVVRGWPDSVVITLTERLPVAVVEQDGVRSLVDRTGTLYDTVTGPAPDGVVPLDVPSPGTGDRATRAAVQVLTTLPDPVRASVTDVVATGADDVTLTLTGGRTVLWGGQGDPERKARVLAALLAQIEAGTLEPASTIDVSVPDSVVLR